MPGAFDDDERPTARDLATVICPACRDPKTKKPTGRAMIVETSGSGYRSRMSDDPFSCTLCKGACFVTGTAAKLYLEEELRR